MATDRDSAQAKRGASAHIHLKDQDERSWKADSQVLETNEEFDFRLWGGDSFSKEPEMCAADEVFFQGQILPLLQLNSQKFNRYKSRSLDSLLDPGSVREPRSSSFKRQNSSNSTNCTTILTPRVSVSASRVKNRFHTYPSPKPQLRAPLSRQASFGNVCRKSSTWDYFRLGVFPAPEIELQGLKVRCTKNSVSRNGSTSNSNSGATKSGKMSTNTHYRDKSNHGLKQFLEKGGGLLSGCKCSIEMPWDTVIINSRNKSARETESATRAMKEKVVMIEFENEKQRQKQGKNIKAVSRRRRRTFEWLKELSHASYPDNEEESLLLNS